MKLSQAHSIYEERLATLEAIKGKEYSRLVVAMANIESLLSVIPDELSQPLIGEVVALAKMAMRSLGIDPDNKASAGEFFTTVYELAKVSASINEIDIDTDPE